MESSPGKWVARCCYLHKEYFLVSYWKVENCRMIRTREVTRREDKSGEKRWNEIGTVSRFHSCGTAAFVGACMSFYIRAKRARKNIEQGSQRIKRFHYWLANVDANTRSRISSLVIRDGLFLLLLCTTRSHAFQDRTKKLKRREPLTRN